jgi:CheY-like chemotaxis protein
VSASPRPSTLVSNCVLVVDDEEDVRESIREVVEMMGCSARMAGSAEEALKMLDELRPCLVVLDLLMPGMKGDELLGLIRKNPMLAALPVVISTSAPERAPLGTPVLAKPIDVHALCGWIRSTCQCN